jgi:hypothetical protein
MATWEEFRAAALALPGVTETTSWGNRAFAVGGHTFAWERPLRKADLAELGLRAQAGPVVGLRIERVEERPELLAEWPDVYFTIAHFRGHPAILARLDVLEGARLGAALERAWRARAPKRLLSEGRSGA